MCVVVHNEAVVCGGHRHPNNTVPRPQLTEKRPSWTTTNKTRPIPRCQNVRQQPLAVSCHGRGPPRTGHDLITASAHITRLIKNRSTPPAPAQGSGCRAGTPPPPPIECAGHTQRPIGRSWYPSHPHTALCTSMPRAACVLVCAGGRAEFSWERGGGGRASFEQGGGGRGFWTQNLVYQKRPDQIFPIVNFVFSHDGHFGLGRGEGGFGGGVPPPWLLIILKKPWGGGGPGTQKSKSLCTKNSQINISLCKNFIFSRYEIRVRGGGVSQEMLSCSATLWGRGGIPYHGRHLPMKVLDANAKGSL